jgi:hypothetical protein
MLYLILRPLANPHLAQLEPPELKRYKVDLAILD